MSIGQICVFSSYKGGLGVKLQKALGRPIQIRHHCLSHRYDLVTDNAMEGFSIFNYFDSAMRALYSFYSVSHKRMNSLLEFLKFVNMPKFRLAAIFDVRWIASFRNAVEKVKKNINPLVGHFNFILNNLKDFVQNKRAAFRLKVQTMKDFLTNKFAMCLLHFNYDILDRFSIESVYTQRKGSSLIGAGRRKRLLIRDLKSIQSEGGKEFQKFLSKCNCFKTVRQATAFVNGRGTPRPCSGLQDYEANPFIVYDKIVLKETGLKDPVTNELKYTKISEIIGPYVDELIKQLENYLPNDELLKFDGLDQRTWRLTDLNLPNVKDLAELFGMDKDVIQQQFNKFFNDMLKKYRVKMCHFSSTYQLFFTKFFIISYILVVLQAQVK